MDEGANLLASRRARRPGCRTCVVRISLDSRGDAARDLATKVGFGQFAQQVFGDSNLGDGWLPGLLSLADLGGAIADQDSGHDCRRHKRRRCRQAKLDLFAKRCTGGRLPGKAYGLCKMDGAWLGVLAATGSAALLHPRQGCAGESTSGAGVFVSGGIVEGQRFACRSALGGPLFAARRRSSCDGEAVARIAPLISFPAAYFLSRQPFSALYGRPDEPVWACVGKLIRHT